MFPLKDESNGRIAPVASVDSIRTWLSVEYLKDPSSITISFGRALARRPCLVRAVQPVETVPIEPLYPFKNFRGGPLYLFGNIFRRETPVFENRHCLLPGFLAVGGSHFL